MNVLAADQELERTAAPRAQLWSFCIYHPTAYASRMDMPFGEMPT